MSNENQFLESEDNNNDNNDNEDVTYMDIGFFNNTLQEFLKLDQEIKKLTIALKARRDKKERLSEMILTFLKRNDISQVELSGDYKGKQIKEAKTQTMTGFNKKNVNEVLMNYFENNVEDYNKIVKKIEDKMVKKENSRLKMNKIKIDKNLQKKMKSQQMDELLSNN